MSNSERRLRILQIGKFYPPYAGGIETHLEELSTQLQHFADVKVIVANTGRHSVTEEVSGIPVHRAGTVTNFANVPISPGMVAEIRRSPAHIVHVHWPNPMAVMAYLASGHRGRLVLTYHSDIVKQKLVALPFQPIFNLFMKRCRAVIATSPNYAATSPVLSQFSKLCHVIPYGIAADRLLCADPAIVESVRRQYGPRIILAVGRLVYYKGFEYLVRAMQSVNGRALIVGDGPLRESLRSLAVSCGVADRVTFIGEKSGKDLVPYFHAADLFALPSIARSEAFGIVQLEAMACGKAVINTTLDSGVPFVSLDGRTGLSVPPSDSRALAGAINKLLDNDDVRSNYGEAGRRRVAEEFRLETMVHRVGQVYRQVLESVPLIDEERISLPPEFYAVFPNALDETSF
jgi:glycosyltransferase involved in cell wall biosynthesis